MASSLITLTVFFVLLCSGGALVCALGRGSFEDALPLTCTAIVTAGFVFGIVGLLPAGFYAALAAAVSAIAAAIYLLVRNGAGDFRKRFFTPGFFIFAALYIFLAAINYGMRLTSWDEFSHWGDIVKVMTTIGGFGTAAMSDSMFPAYPPAMALFQYFCERIYMLVSGESMAEWLLYFSYQTFMFAMFFPFLRRFDLKKAWSWAFFAVIWLLPLIFQRNAYSKIYIDSFLSVLLALGLAHALIDREGERLDRLNLAAILILLPLTKSIGLPFAAAVLIAVFAAEYGERTEGFRRRCALYTCAALVPRAAWELHVRLSRAVSGYGPSAQIAAEHFGNRDYTGAVLSDYLEALVRRPLTNEEAICPQLCALAVLALLTAALWLLLKRESDSRNGDKLYPRAFALLLAVNVLFFAIMGAGFMYAYPEAEALELLGMERYLNNILMADAVLALMLTADLISRGAVGTKRAAAAVLAAALLFTPFRTAARTLTRRDVHTTQALHSRFEPYYETLNALTQGERCDILFAADRSDTIEFMLLRTELRPSYVEMMPLPESVARFDYVVIYDLASPPDGTENGGIYAVDGEELIRVN